MVPRHARLFCIGWLIAALSGAVFGSTLAPQESAPTDKVKSFANATRDMMRYGGSATAVLGAAAKTESASTSGLLTTIGQTLKDKAAAAGTDTAPANVETEAKKLVQAAKDLLQLRDKALAPLAEAQGDPANADVKDILAKAEMRIYMALCITAMRFYISTDNRVPGTFDGMFASLDKYNRDKIADAFLEVFRSSTQPAPLRELAGEGLAQMGSARHQPALKAMISNPNENSRVQERAVYTLARLGDRTIVDKMLKEIETKMAELKKPDMTAAEARGWASGYYRSAMLMQNIHDQAASIKYYEQYVAALDSIGEKNTQGLDGVFYNLACLYSLKGDVDLGLKNLDKAFSVGYENYKWANTDGDLANLRKDPRWKPLIEKWESGKKPESAPASRPQ